MVVFTVIAGVPERLSGATPSVIVSDPATQPAWAEGGVLPSCSSATATAEPPSRLAALASELSDYGAGAVVASICAHDDTQAFASISAAIVRCVIGPGACLPSLREVRSDGTVACDLHETLPARGEGARHTRCAELGAPGTYELVRVDRATDGAGRVLDREVCRVRQLTRAELLGSDEPGWFWDDGTAGAASDLPEYCAHTITLRGTAYVIGAEVSLECTQRLGAAPPALTALGLGERCDPTEYGQPCPGPLRCDPLLALCGVPCTAVADCRAAGLPNHACDDEPRGPESARGFCVSPTCSS